MSNHWLLEKKCLRLALKYELGRMCIRVAALVYLTFVTSLVCSNKMNTKKKAKAVLLHAAQALCGRRGIAPTHSRPQHEMGWVLSVTPRPHFSPRERTLGTHCTGGWLGLIACLDTEVRGETPSLCRGRTSIAQSSIPLPDTIVTKLPGSQQNKYCKD
jgi:hypothetical protein